jgi:putative heme iron utilization protein
VAATTPFRDVDAEALALTRRLLIQARHGALGVIDPQTGAPMVSRIAFALLSGRPHTLVSDLSHHADALRANPAASVLVGEPGPKGDPLTHPRLTLQVRAEAADKAALKEAWLAACPKAQLYYDFADFNLLRLAPTSALLNGGFGKAYRLDPGSIRTALA